MSELEKTVEALRRCVPAEVFDAAMAEVNQTAKPADPQPVDVEEIILELLTELGTPAHIKGHPYHAKFNTTVILRADHKTQIEALSLAVSSFLYTPNEAREFLDKPAVEGGDQLLGNGASIPVQYTGSQYTNISGREEDKQWLITTIAAAVKAALA